MATKMTEEQIARAKAVPLVEYLKKRGYELKRDGAHYVRLVEHSSLVISLEHNLWKWNTGDMGGDTIDFLMKYEGKSFPDAVMELIEEYPADRIAPIKRKAERERGKFVLPLKNDTHNRVYAYLTKTRGIAPSIVRELLDDDTLYESAKYHNAVFVRYVDGVPRYCFKRGTSTYKAWGVQPASVGFTDAVKRYISNFFNFKGRCGRAEFWWTELALILCSLGLSILSSILSAVAASVGVSFLDTLGTVLTVAFSVFTIIPSFSMVVRRLHDIGKSRWCVLVGLIPFVGPFILLYWYCRRSE